MVTFAACLGVIGLIILLTDLGILPPRHGFDKNVSLDTGEALTTAESDDFNYMFRLGAQLQLWPLTSSAL